MNKQDAIALLQKLSSASVNHYVVCFDNEAEGLDIDKTEALELAAVKELLRHLTPDVIEDSDLRFYN